MNSLKMNLSELPDDSDSSDEDYIPNKEDNDSDHVSDVEESPVSESEDGETKKRKIKKNASKSRKSQKKSIESSASADHVDSEPNEITQEEKKKQEDDLWADFMRDTGFQSKMSVSAENKTSNQSSSNTAKSSNTITSKPEKLKVTEIFHFAGEEVKVEKEVDANSAEAKLLHKTNPTTNDQNSRRLGGLGSIVSQLGKKNKISTLEKSKLDWNRFKKEEKLDEELQTYNRGKDGYLERQDFLQRADLRTFEIEKEIRNKERSKRLN